jgi:hypothetical protein
MTQRLAIKVAGRQHWVAAEWWWGGANTGKHDAV